MDYGRGIQDAWARSHVPKPWGREPRRRFAAIDWPLWLGLVLLALVVLIDILLIRNVAAGHDMPW